MDEDNVRIVVKVVAIVLYVLLCFVPLAVWIIRHGYWELPKLLRREDTASKTRVLIGNKHKFCIDDDYSNYKNNFLRQNNGVVPCGYSEWKKQIELFLDQMRNDPDVGIDGIRDFEHYINRRSDLVVTTQEVMKVLAIPAGAALLAAVVGDDFSLDWIIVLLTLGSVIEIFTFGTQMYYAADLTRYFHDIKEIIDQYIKKNYPDIK